MSAEHRLDFSFCFSGGVFRVTQIAQIEERVLKCLSPGMSGGPGSLDLNFTNRLLAVPIQH